MWSFPIVSIALGLLSWRRVKVKSPLMLLMIGLALQTFSYLEFSVAPGLENHSLVALGKGFFIGLLYVLYAGMGVDNKPDFHARIELKVILLAGMIFLTLSNLVSPKVSEAFLAILCILFPALFWPKLKKQEPLTITSAFFLAFMAFFSFLLTWSKYLIDFFNLSPILWMLSFTAGLYIFLNLEESR